MHMYRYVHAHVWSKGQSQASFPGTLPTSFEHISHWLGDHQLDYIGCPLSPKDPLVSASTMWDYKLPHLAFLCGV